MASSPSHPQGMQGSNLSKLRRGVRENLRNGLFRLSRERRAGRRSAVWEHFRMVEDSLGVSVGYAGCLHCLDVLRHEPHVSGTSSLFSHLRACPAYAAQEAHFPEAAELPEVSVKEELMEDDPQQEPQQDSPLLEACVDCLALDLMPSQVLHGAGFVRLAQLLVDCGARQGAMDARALLPTQAQVEARLAVRATEERQQLRSQLTAGGGRGGALVLCAYLGQQGPRVLFLRTLHDWCFQTRFLGVCPPPPLEADHDEARAGVAAILKKFELSEGWEELPLVCGGPVRGLGEVVPCASDMLCKAVTHLLQAPQPPLQQVRDYLDKFRDLVRWAAATQDKELVGRLSTDGGDQRAWQQTMAMVESVCRMCTELEAGGADSGVTFSPGDAALGVMKHLTAVLEPMRAAAADLEAPEAATLHKVVPWLLHLRNSCAPHARDSDEQAAMKVVLREGLDTHANPCLLHRIAVFFNPRMNSLNVLRVEDQQEVRETVRCMAFREKPPASKGITKTRPEGPLAYLEDACQDSLTVEREMEVYAIIKDDAVPEDLLGWWRRKAPLLPLLAAAAIRVLVVPASTTTLTLDTVSDKLLRPSPPNLCTADDLIYLHSRLAHI